MHKSKFEVYRSIRVAIKICRYACRQKKIYKLFSVSFVYTKLKKNQKISLLGSIKKLIIIIIICF